MKSITDGLDQEPILEFEGFVIRPYDAHTLWFEGPDGDGTQISKAVFLGLLVRFFKEQM